MSIHRTLLFSLLAGLLACAIVITVVAYLNSAHEMHELFGDSMKRTAAVIKDQIFAKSGSQQDANNLGSDEVEESSVIQIWNGQGKLLHSSPQDVELPLQPNEGFGSVTIKGQKWKTYTAKAGNDGFVQVAQPRRIVTTMIEESAARTLIPFAILFALLGLGAWLIVGRSLAPLSHLSRLIASRDIDQLKPISTLKVPNEIQPIVRALNELLTRLDEAMELQRQFTADAAHELRTPLAAVKIQADLLNRAQSPADRNDAIKKLSEGIERSINMASQLLSASLASTVKSTLDFKTLSLDLIVESCISTFAPIAAQKHANITFAPRERCTISADEEGIRVLVNNLLDNAIRHTPGGGNINVSLCMQDKKPVLKIADTGPGIAEAEKSKIFQRFYRVPGTSFSGAGLGLAIVKDIANNHGAVVTVTNGPGNRGAMFSIIFRPQFADLAA